jgi:PAS domain S-box-containing protein
VSEVAGAGRASAGLARDPFGLGLIRCDRFLTVTDAEVAACRLLRQRREELLDESFLKFVEDDAVDLLADLADRLANRGLDATTLDLRVRERSGGLRRVQLTLAFLPADSRTISPLDESGCFLLTLEPLTRPGRDAEAFQVATGSLAERAPDLIMRYRLWPERNFDYVSPSSTDVLGYPPSAFYANPDLFHELVDDASELEQLFKLYEGRWEPHEPVILRVVHRDGRARVLEQRTTCVHDGERRLLAVESISRDITDRMTEQLELRTMDAVLKLLHEKAPTDLDTAEPSDILRAAIEAVCAHLNWPVGHAFMLDADPGYLTSVAWHFVEPERFEPLRVLTDEHRWPVEADLAGDSVILAEPTVTNLPDSRGSERSCAAAACGLGVAVTLPISVAGGIGAAIEFFTESSSHPDPAVLAGIQGAATEVGRALLRSDKVLHLRRLDEARQEFVARAAHELRGPVGSIALMASALAREARKSDQSRMASSLESLAAQAERIQTLATRLLALSQLEEGRLELRPEPIAVRTAVQAAMSGLAVHPSTIDLAVDGEVRVLADAMLLDQMLSNLLANAQRHGGPQITVTACAEDRHVAISVADDGPGVPADLVDLLFEPMQQGLATPERGGLGLALVRRMASAQAGTIRYEANEPSGARFTVLLPAVVEGADEPGDDPGDDPAEASAPE